MESSSTEATASLLLTMQLLLQASRRRRMMIRERNNGQTMKRHRRWQQFNERMYLEQSLFREMACLAATNSDVRYPYDEPVKKSKWWEDNVKNKHNSKEWTRYFRVSKETFFYLIKEMELILCHSDSPACYIPVDKRIAITLFRLASGKDFASVATLFEVTKECVAVVTKEVCETIVNVFMKKYVEVPSASKLIAITTVFECEWNLPQCAGIVGSIHIPLSEISGATAEHKNRNGWCSVILQTVIDPSYKFWDFNIGWPGSVSDTTVFMRSSLWEKGNEGSLFVNLDKKIEGVNVPILLAANSAYPLADWVIKPYHNTGFLTKEQIHFNEKLSYIQENIVDVAFKRLRARWQCLVKSNENNLELLPAVIASCCILHNICENRAEKIPKEWFDELKQQQVYGDLEIIPINSILSDKAVEIRQALACYTNTLCSNG